MEEESISLFDLDLKIDDASGTYLRNAARWARVVSIFFIVFTAFIVMCLALMLIYRNAMIDQWTRSGVYYPGITKTAEGMFYMFVLVILFLIGLLSTFAFLLLRFSNRTKRAIAENSAAMLETSIASLKTYMIIAGLFAILFALNGLYKFINIFI